MTPALLLALAFTLAVGIILFIDGTRRQAIAFALIAVAMAPASFLPLGHAAPWRPDMPATVLGARIDVGLAIWVLVDGPEPRFHRLPYSQAAADQLQAAIDGAAERQGKVKIKMGEDGSPGFAEEAPPEEPAKSAERPALLQ